MITESFIITCIRRLREYGEGIVFADQCLSSLREVVKSNVYTTLCLSQSGYKDIKEVIRIMGLNPEQAEIILRMKTGEGIIRKAGGRFSYPQLIRIPFVRPKNLSNREIDKLNEKNEVIQHLLKRVKPRETAIEQIESGLKVKKPQAKTNEKDSTSNVKKDLKKLLEALAKNSFEVSTKIMKLAGFSGRKNGSISGSKSVRIKKIAIERGYIKEHKISLGVRGGMRKYMEITDTGYSLLDELCVDYERPRGKGSFEHRLYEHIVANFYAHKGYRVRIEACEYVE